MTLNRLKKGKGLKQKKIKKDLNHKYHLCKSSCDLETVLATEKQLMLIALELQLDCSNLSSSAEQRAWELFGGLPPYLIHSSQGLNEFL